MTIQEIIDIIDKAYFAVASGTNTYIISSVSGIPPLQAYKTGKHYIVKFINSNTSVSVTMSIDGLPPRNIYSNSNSPLTVGAIPANSILELIDNGTNFQIVGGGGSGSGSVTQTINSSLLNFSQTII